jgi:hypothetical protein
MLKVYLEILAVEILGMKNEGKYCNKEGIQAME